MFKIMIFSTIRNPLALLHLVRLPEIITPSPIMLKMQAT
jgi:hypothetical protein